MTITPTLLNYYLICHRKTWLHANGIRMEETSDVVYEGKLIGESSYPRRAAKYTELDLGVAKIEKLIHRKECLPRLDKKALCRSCSYFDFCWSGEE